jgi:hypothetical protein
MTFYLEKAGYFGWGRGRLKAMPFSKLCVSFQSFVKNEKANGKFVKEEFDRSLTKEEVLDETD